MKQDRSSLALFCKSCNTMTLHRVAGYKAESSKCWAYCLMPYCGVAQDLKLDNVQYAIGKEGRNS